MDCLESKISNQTPLIRKLYYVHRIDDAELLRKLNAVNSMGVATILPSEEQIRMQAKDHLNALAKEADVHCPDTHRAYREDFFSHLDKDQLEYPLVIKGVFYDAAVVHTESEAVMQFRRISGQWGLPVLVQEFVDGEEINLTGLGDGRGGLVGAVMMKKRALTDKGKAWAGVSIHDEALLGAARRLVEVTRWRGPLEVEIMRRPNGDLSLIEINPRFPAWIYLSVGVGQNLPEMLVRLALGETVPEPPVAPAGIIFIRYALETIVSLSDFESMVTKGERHG